MRETRIPVWPWVRLKRPGRAEADLVTDYPGLTARPATDRLRVLGHDVLTAMEGGQSNRTIGDPAVLAFATAAGRAVLTANRRVFIRLHRRTPAHAGIVIRTADPDVAGQADRIDRAIRDCGTVAGCRLHVNRPD